MKAKEAVHKHEANMHPGKKPTKLAKGGKTNLQMKEYGRGMAKVMNQRVSSAPKGK
jgi:hypothetical protein